MEDRDGEITIELWSWW